MTLFFQQAANQQSQYIELLTRSSDYYKFLGELLKNMEELKVNIERTVSSIAVDFSFAKNAKFNVPTQHEFCLFLLCLDQKHQD